MSDDFYRQIRHIPPTKEIETICIEESSSSHCFMYKIILSAILLRYKNLKEDFCNFFFAFPFTLYSTQNIHTFLCDSDLKHDAKDFYFLLVFGFENKKSFYKMVKQHKEKKVEKRHLRHVYYYYLLSCHLRFSQKGNQN
jgi:hypothetical protein